jgi:hypothetical protein
MMGKGRPISLARRIALLPLAGAGLLTLASAWFSLTVFWYPPAGKDGRGWHFSFGGGNAGIGVVRWIGSNGWGPREMMLRRHSGGWLPALDLSLERRPLLIQGFGPPYSYHVPVFIVLLPLGAWATWRAAAAPRRRGRHGCAGCGYDLRGLSAACCPECGRTAD